MAELYTLRREVNPCTLGESYIPGSCQPSLLVPFAIGQKLSNVYLVACGFNWLPVALGVPPKTRSGKLIKLKWLPVPSVERAWLMTLTMPWDQNLWVLWAKLLKETLARPLFPGSSESDQLLVTTQSHKLNTLSSLFHCWTLWTGSKEAFLSFLAPSGPRLYKICSVLGTPTTVASAVCVFAGQFGWLCDSMGRWFCLHVLWRLNVRLSDLLMSLRGCSEHWVCVFS